MAAVIFSTPRSGSNFKTVDSPKIIIYNDVIPFRVRFSSIGIPGVVGLVPPIGIAIIGVNNYIL